MLTVRAAEPGLLLAGPVRVDLAADTVSVGGATRPIEARDWHVVRATAAGGYGTVSVDEAQVFAGETEEAPWSLHSFDAGGVHVVRDMALRFLPA